MTSSCRITPSCRITSSCRITPSCRITSIDKLIKLTTPPKKIIELSQDITEFENHLQCKICNSESGTLKIIFHKYNCKYAIPYIIGPFIYGNIHQLQPINTNIAENILQGEIGFTDKTKNKKIIGSFGALTCIILCMRNRKTTKTALAHIDCVTINPLLYFWEFDPFETDVCIIGGNTSSLKLVNTIISEIYNKKYSIKYCNILDEKSNCFAINSETSEAYIDDQVELMIFTPLTINKTVREHKLLLFSKMIYERSLDKIIFL
jgi:hypothetical protein